MLEFVRAYFRRLGRAMFYHDPWTVIDGDKLTVYWVDWGTYMASGVITGKAVTGFGSSPTEARQNARPDN